LHLPNRPSNQNRAAMASINRHSALALSSETE
jgi:hypothetical protein